MFQKQPSSYSFRKHINFQTNKDQYMNIRLTHLKCTSFSLIRFPIFLWQNLRSVNYNKRVSTSNLPDELVIDDETFTGSKIIATKLNDYFTSIAYILYKIQEEPPGT